VVTPDAAGIEAALAAGLAAHQIVWENDGGDYGGRSWFECTCDADDVLDATEYATEAAHRAHQAAALLPVVTQAQAAERERVARAIEAEKWQFRRVTRAAAGDVICRAYEDAARIARADESGGAR
jgi:hypothetical protein